jgi:hypothetical protein
VSSKVPVRPVVDRQSAGPVEVVVDPAARRFRRSFTAAYRAQVVAEYEAAPQGRRLRFCDARPFPVTGVPLDCGP